MIRAYCSRDFSGVVDCFNRSVREIAARHYTAEQVAAWAPAEPDLRMWETRLKSGGGFVADEAGIIAGFLRIGEQGYVDLLYVHPLYERQGIGRELLLAGCAWAAEQGAQGYEADVSLAARPLFERSGFRLVREQVVERRGVAFRNCRMARGR